MLFVFIERDSATWSNLGMELIAFASERHVPKQLRIVDPILGEFSAEMTKVLDLIEEQRGTQSPAFVFIDPFGPTGFPLNTIARVMRNPSCEVFIRLNYTRLGNNFIQRKNMESHLDDLFETSEWKRARGLAANERERFLVGLYLQRLTDGGGARLVQPFRTIDPTGHVAYFIFGTNSSRGFEEMKDAMWKVDPEGTFRWRASAQVPPGQTSFLPQLADESSEAELFHQLRAEFAGRRLRVAELEEFVRCQRDLLMRHLRPALTKLEAGGFIRVERPEKVRRAGTFPADLIVEFFA